MVKAHNWEIVIIGGLIEMKGICGNSMEKRGWKGETSHSKPPVANRMDLNLGFKI